MTVRPFSLLPLRNITRAITTLARCRVAMDMIKVHNSLKPGAPVALQTIKPGEISWYACGPTVYDDSHLGHARNYVSTDIIRRILRDYFGFKVKFVMNFTDIDDKIILKARRQSLLETEERKPYTEDEIAEMGKSAFQEYARNNLPALIGGGTPELDIDNYASRRDTAYGSILAGGTLTGNGKPGDAEAKLKMHISNMDQAAAAIHSKTWSGLTEILLPFLDHRYKESVDTSDHSMFTNLTRKMEASFTEDMRNLNVLEPDVVTRVTEYVPQIVDFVERIVDKGFAYEADGSVYFDITAFEKAGNTYARLRPDSKNDKALQEEGEGSLSKGSGGKRGLGDFALWKKSKAGEPRWPSRWGDGRPGWHIECSVMASDVLGEQMDLHSGGIDLAFPHHDNELAQSEAYYCQGGHEHTWVKYFLHMGHLSISGSKMSKSLKNFQTIKSALKTDYTARSMRIVFLLGRWNDGVEISPEMRTQADNWEKTVDNFFRNARSLLAEYNVDSLAAAAQDLKIGDVATVDGLLASLNEAREDLDAALRNSFDTPGCLHAVKELIGKVNTDVAERLKKGVELDLRGLEATARWITRIVGIFGLDSNGKPPYEGVGWVIDDSSFDLESFKTTHAVVNDEIETLNKTLASDTVASLLSSSRDSSQAPDAKSETLARSGVKDPELLARPYLESIRALREGLRTSSSIPTGISDPQQKKEASDRREAILKLSDRIRDEHLLNLGVQLEDQSNGQPALIKFVPVVELREEREGKRAQEARAKEEAATAAKARKQAEEARLQLERKRAEIPPDQLYKDAEGLASYGSWDEMGVPVTLKDGTPVPKSQLKRLKKMQAVHEVLRNKHRAYLETVGQVRSPIPK